MRLAFLVTILCVSAVFSHGQVLYPNTFDLGNMTIGLTYVRTMTLKNTSNATIHPQHGLCNGYASSGPNMDLPDSIAAGDSVILTMSYRSMSEYPLDLACGIISDRNTYPTERWSVGYTLKGNEIYKPSFSVQPTSITFDSTAVGDTATATLIIRNSGNGMGLAYRPTGIGSDYSTSITEDSVEIPAADSVAITVRFHPQQIGETHDTVLLRWSLWGTQQIVPVMGSGIAPPGGLVATPRRVDFATDIRNGNVYQPMRLAVLKDSLVLSNLVLGTSGKFFVTAVDGGPVSLPATLRPGTSLNVHVVAIANESGTWQDTIACYQLEQLVGSIPLRLDVGTTSLSDASSTMTCLPFPQPSTGSLSWCGEPDSRWIIRYMDGRKFQDVVASDDGTCTVRGLPTGAFAIHRADLNATPQLVIVTH